MPNYNYPYTPQPLYPQTMQPSMPQQNVQQIQDGGFVTIPSEDMVYSYPVAMGKCVTFKIEGRPIIIEKSMGFSQLDAPKIERYRLVKEEEKPEEYSEERPRKSELDSIRSDIKKIWGAIDEIKDSPKRNSQRRENKDGES